MLAPEPSLAALNQEELFHLIRLADANGWTEVQRAVINQVEYRAEQRAGPA